MRPRASALLLLAACLGGLRSGGKGESLPAESRGWEDELDQDGDGWTALADGGGDCDDLDPQVNPGAEELCADGLDDDCDGRLGTCGLAEHAARVSGETAGANLGFSAALVGDVDGDGAGDLLLGAVGADDLVEDGGEIWLLGGPLSGEHGLEGALASVLGAEEEMALGYAVAGPGDLDGDGYADPAFSAPYAEEGRGAVFVTPGPLLGLRRADEGDPAWTGEAAGDRAGVALAAIGDVDEDGIPDLLVGANTADLGGADAGAAYLLAGAEALVGGELSGATARIWGEEAGDRAGRVSAAGDVDGDGVLDMLVGAPDGGEPGGGLAGLLLGPVLGDRSLADADLRLVGATAGERAGAGLAGLGDADGDGRSDLAVGGNGSDAEAADAGAVWLVLAPPLGSLPLTEADACLRGEAGADMAGWPLAAPGDLDRDGLADLLVGAFANDAADEQAGATYAVSGLTRGTGSLGDAMARWLGEEGGDAAGFALAAAPGEGGAEPTLVIGAYGREAGAGAAYVLEGMF